MKPILKRIKVIERQMPEEPEEIEYTRMPPEMIKLLETITRKKITEDEKFIKVSKEPLHPEIEEMVQKILGYRE